MQTYNGVQYDPNKDYQAAINEAMAKGQTGYASQLNTERNAKIAAGAQNGIFYTDYSGNTVTQNQTATSNQASNNAYLAANNGQISPYAATAAGYMPAQYQPQQYEPTGNSASTATTNSLNNTNSGMSAQNQPVIGTAATPLYTKTAANTGTTTMNNKNSPSAELLYGVNELGQKTGFESDAYRDTYNGYVVLQGAEYDERRRMAESVFGSMDTWTPSMLNAFDYGGLTSLKDLMLAQNNVSGGGFDSQYLANAQKTNAAFNDYVDWLGAYNSGMPVTEGWSSTNDYIHSYDDQSGVGYYWDNYQQKYVPVNKTTDVSLSRDAMEKAGVNAMTDYSGVSGRTIAAPGGAVGQVSREQLELIVNSPEYSGWPEWWKIAAVNDLGFGNGQIIIAQYMEELGLSGLVRPDMSPEELAALVKQVYAYNRANYNPTSGYDSVSGLEGYDSLAQGRARNREMALAENGAELSNIAKYGDPNYGTLYQAPADGLWLENMRRYKAPYEPGYDDYVNWYRSVYYGGDGYGAGQDNPFDATQPEPPNPGYYPEDKSEDSQYNPDDYVPPPEPEPEPEPETPPEQAPEPAAEPAPEPTPEPDYYIDTQRAYYDALRRWQTTGMVLPSDAAVLGIPAGTPYGLVKPGTEGSGDYNMYIPPNEDAALDPSGEYADYLYRQIAEQGYESDPEKWAAYYGNPGAAGDSSRDELALGYYDYLAGYDNGTAAVGYTPQQMSSYQQLLTALANNPNPFEVMKRAKESLGPDIYERSLGKELADKLEEQLQSLFS